MSLILKKILLFCFSVNILIYFIALNSSFILVRHLTLLFKKDYFDEPFLFDQSWTMSNSKEQVEMAKKNMFSCIYCLCCEIKISLFYACLCGLAFWPKQCCLWKCNFSKEIFFRNFEYHYSRINLSSHEKGNRPKVSFESKVFSALFEHHSINVQAGLE